MALALNNLQHAIKQRNQTKPLVDHTKERDTDVK